MQRKEFVVNISIFITFWHTVKEYNNFDIFWTTSRQMIFSFRIFHNKLTVSVTRGDWWTFVKQIQFTSGNLWQSKIIKSENFRVILEQKILKLAKCSSSLKHGGYFTRQLWYMTFDSKEFSLSSFLVIYLAVNFWVLKKWYW